VEEAPVVIEGTSGNGRSRAVRAIGAALVLIEAVVAVGYGGYLAVESVVGTATERGAAVALAVSALVIGLGLALLARALVRRRRAARAPLVVWQLMQIAVGYPALESAWFVAVPLVVCAVLVIACLFVPDVVDDVRR
jgi:hypothetical protein